MKLGIIAGAGVLPVILAQEAKRAGRQILVISVTKNTDDRLSFLTPEFYQIGAGQIGKMLDTLVDMGVEETAIIGKVSKELLLKPMHLDVRAIKILSKLRNKSDPSLFAAIAEEIESTGIKIVDQRLYLGELLPQKGVLTKRKLSREQERDVEYGMELARKIAELGVGQTVVIKNQIPLAVEAIEGTNDAIRRGGKLCGNGAVVAKAALADHDFRFDVPTIGLDTVDVLVESKAAVLAVESGRAFLLDCEETVAKANKAKISLVVV